MKTILHISKYYYPDLGGIETVAMYLAEGMTNYHNVVICFATDGMYSEEDIRGVTVYRVPVNFSFMSQDVALTYRKVLKQVIKQEKPEAVHVHCPNPFIYPLVCTCVDKKTKVVLHWHSDILSKGLMYYLVKPFETAILRRADVIISTSPNYIPDSKPLQRHIDKVRIAQNGIISERFYPLLGDEEKVKEIRARYKGKKIVFTCGRHIPYKGLDNLIKAEQLRHSHRRQGSHRRRTEADATFRPRHIPGPIAERQTSPVPLCCRHLRLPLEHQGRSLRNCSGRSHVLPLCFSQLRAERFGRKLGVGR